MDKNQIIEHERTNEIAIIAPACVGSKRKAIFDSEGNFVEWGE